MSLPSDAPRQEIGRLAGWRILGSTILSGGFAATMIWGFLVLDNGRTKIAVASIGVALAIHAARMLCYFAAILLNGGCGLYVREGRLVLLFPFFKSMRLEEVTAVTLGGDYFVVGWPRYVLIRGWGDQKIFVHSFYFRTSFRETAARLKALGLAVAEDPRLKVDPFAPEPR